jgi:hypothetical protein
LPSRRCFTPWSKRTRILPRFVVASWNYRSRPWRRYSRRESRADAGGRSDLRCDKSVARRPRTKSRLQLNRRSGSSAPKVKLTGRVGRRSSRYPPRIRLGHLARAELASLIDDRLDNGNNRWDVAAELNRRLRAWPGPYWNVPAKRARPELTVRKPACPRAGLQKYRLVEQRLRASGRVPQSAWKLFTTGSVGSQALLGIPTLERLRSDPALAVVSHVWPFDIRVVERRTIARPRPLRPARRGLASRLSGRSVAARSRTQHR